MAYLRQDKRTKHWTVGFRYEGCEFKHSCKTARKTVATRVLATIEETIELLHNGRQSIPEGVAPRLWIISGGKSKIENGRHNAPELPLEAMCDAYTKDQLQKADTTLLGEAIHIRHLNRLLRSSKRFSSITLDCLKSYAKRRLEQKHRGQFISAATVRKELGTFRQIWIWAQRHKDIQKSCPLLGPDGRWEVKLPKPVQRRKFQTWRQIESRISRGNLSGFEEKKLWRTLFLDNDQVNGLLEHVRISGAHSFIYPMFAFTAYTGARRSEICRSEIDDFDFDQNQILIRERKRRKDLAATFRFVPLHPKLRKIMKNWFEQHPGGHKTLVLPLRMPGQPHRKEHLELTPDKATKHFEAAIRKTKWDVISGFHVLRHSFGSNLARSGKVSSSTIGAWMGHSTEEMRELYQHLFPQDGVDQISVLG